MAFQPIIDIGTGRVYAYEALVRGPNGESAGQILAQVNDDNRYSFDQSCRVKAIELAAKLGLPATGAHLSINFLPNAVYQPAACIRATVEAAQRVDFPLDRLIFEVTEGEKVKDRAHLASIVTEYRRRGLRTAIDDFGAGYAGLNLLAEFQPDLLKIDMDLTRDIDKSRVKQVIVGSIVSVCRQLDLTVIAEGIETGDELKTLTGLGITLFQGYLFAKPAFEALPVPAIPDKTLP